MIEVAGLPKARGFPATQSSDRCCFGSDRASERPTCGPSYVSGSYGSPGGVSSFSRSAASCSGDFHGLSAGGRSKRRSSICSVHQSACTYCTRTLSTFSIRVVCDYHNESCTVQYSTISAAEAGEMGHLVHNCGLPGHFARAARIAEREIRRNHQPSQLSDARAARMSRLEYCTVHNPFGNT